MKGLTEGNLAFAKEEIPFGCVQDKLRRYAPQNDTNERISEAGKGVSWVCHSERPEGAKNLFFRKLGDSSVASLPQNDTMLEILAQITPVGID